MIFSIKQEQRVNELIEKYTNYSETNIVSEWVLKEEDRKYINTRDESLTIAIGHGELTHLDNLDYLEESYHYYSNKKQLNYIINVFRFSNLNDIRIVVYKCNNGQLNGSHKLLSETVNF